ncbi:unnamed protein product [Sphagnum troendelagicum]
MRRRRRIHFFPILVDEEHVHLHLDKIFVVRLPSVPLFRLMILLGAMAAASQLGCSNMHWDSKSLLPFVFNNQRYLLKQRWRSVMLVLLLLLLLLTYNKGNLGQLVFQIWGKCSACCPEGCHKDAIHYHDSYHVSMARKMLNSEAWAVPENHWYHVVPNEEEPLMTFTHIARFCDSIAQYLDVRKLKICLAWLLHPHQRQST